MRLQLKRVIGVLVLAAMAAMLVAAMGTSTAGASEWKFRGFPVDFLGEGLGVSTFLSTELNSVNCLNSHSKGSFVSTSLANATIYYLNKCELVVEKSTLGKFKEACPNILTHELDIKPASKLNGGAKAGLLVQALIGTQTIATFNCTGSNKVEVKVKGSVFCETTNAGVIVTLDKIVCKANAAKHGEQEFTTGEVGGSTIKASLIAESTLSIFKITEKDSQETSEDLEYNQAIEQTK